MLDIKSYVSGLLSKCPQRDVAEFIKSIWKFDKVIELTNTSVDGSILPTADMSGATHKIKFLDKNNKDLGHIEFYLTNTGAHGIRLNAYGQKLGIEDTDEHIAQSYCEHPTGDEEHQIVTLGYYREDVAELKQYLQNLLEALSEELQERMQKIEDKYDELASKYSDLQTKITNINDAIGDLSNGVDSILTKMVKKLAGEGLHGTPNTSNTTYPIGCIRQVQIVGSVETNANSGGIYIPGLRIKGKWLRECNLNYSDDRGERQNTFGIRDTEFSHRFQSVEGKDTAGLGGTWVLLSPMLKNEACVGLAIKVDNYE